MQDFIPAVDTHAHVFDAGCRFVEGRRYTPGYDAPTARYIAVLDRAGVRHGVLVQPSAARAAQLAAALLSGPGKRSEA